MVDDPRISERDAALRAVLVQHVNSDRSAHRSTPGDSGETARKRLPMLATAIVIIGVVALSAAAIAAGQARISAASSNLASPTASRLTSTSSPSTTATAKASYSGPLIAMDGSQTLTRAQLHAYTLKTQGSSANSAIGEEQDWLDIQCMAKHGYLYDPTHDGTYREERGKAYGLTAAQRKGYDIAFFGPKSSEHYNWRTAGCHGRSVHLTGQDNAH